MRHFLTVGIVTLCASTSFAQGGIVYNVNPLPPILSNNLVQYPSGMAYIDTTGTTRICNGQLRVDNAASSSRVICENSNAPIDNRERDPADGLANLAPAAGPSGKELASDKNLLSDSDLGSDRGTLMRSDRKLFGVQ